MVRKIFALEILLGAVLGVNNSSNVTSPFPLELPELTHCNASTDWLPERITIDDLYPDCISATLAFSREADKYSAELFEFRASQRTPVSMLQQKITPLRYAYGK